MEGPVFTSLHVVFVQVTRWAAFLIQGGNLSVFSPLRMLLMRGPPTGQGPRVQTPGTHCEDDTAFSPAHTLIWVISSEAKSVVLWRGAVMRKAGELFNLSSTAIKVPTHWVTMVMGTGCKSSEESAFFDHCGRQTCVFKQDPDLQYVKPSVFCWNAVCLIGQRLPHESSDIQIQMFYNQTQSLLEFFVYFPSKHIDLCNIGFRTTMPHSKMLCFDSTDSWPFDRTVGGICLSDP